MLEEAERACRSFWFSSEDLKVMLSPHINQKSTVGVEIEEGITALSRNETIIPVTEAYKTLVFWTQTRKSLELFRIGLQLMEFLTHAIGYTIEIEQTLCFGNPNALLLQPTRHIVCSFPRPPLKRVWDREWMLEWQNERRGDFRQI